MLRLGVVEPTDGFFIIFKLALVYEDGIKVVLRVQAVIQRNWEVECFFLYLNGLEV
jgi:hypothetical protein